MTAEQFIEKFPDSKLNTNCLLDMGCPACGHRSSFHISILAGVDVDDSGTWDVRNPEWDDDSTCWCNNCDTLSTVSDFTHKGLDELVKQSKSNDHNKVPQES